MEYEEFFEKVKNCVGEMLGGAYMVYHNRVRKNNDIWLDGIVIRHGRETICPTIYLDRAYYGDNKEKEIAAAAKYVVEQYQEALKFDIHREMDLSCEYAMPRIIYRLVNREKNEELLKECPMIPFLDLAVTFHVLLSEMTEKEQATIRISHAMLSAWGLSVKELAKLSEENTKKYLPPVVDSLSGMLGKLTEEEIQGSSRAFDIYVLTNIQNIYGATALIYKDIVRELSQKVQSDLYLLPSSIHEFIIVPVKYHFEKKELEEMVQSVNQTQVSEEEFLSDSIYYYSREEGKFKKL